MKKILIASAFMTCSLPLISQSATIPVYNSIFLAAGYPTHNQHANVNALAKTLKEQTQHGDIEDFVFSSASVDTKTESIEYHFTALKVLDENQRCLIQLEFKVKPTANLNAQLLSSSAQEKCIRDED